jgi:CubicO group peptidase (beta-lactamase class C family)
VDQTNFEQTLNLSIAELTGMKYQDFVEQVIFKAIGMNHSGVFALNKLRYPL